MGKGELCTNNNYKRLVIAGTSSGVGKTSITIGIMKALNDIGYKVQGFKVGPDYIDPSYHTSITGRASRNLDPWLMGEDGLVTSFVNAMHDADVAVVEGVMGMYDGLSGKDDYASTAHVARILKSPVILVLDASKSARSIAAVALGFIRYGGYTRIKGVILNNVASDRHAEYCKEALEQLNIQVVGVVKRSNDIMLEERHLGLIPTYESKFIHDKAYKVASYVKDHLNINALVSIVENSVKERLNISYNKGSSSIIINSNTNSNRKKKDFSIGVALDESFNFYYTDNIDMLKNYADVVFFSPLHDNDLPNCDALYIGGGFPEVLADALSKNISMMSNIRRVAEDGMPIYAECGGLMYLSRCIINNDSKYRMVGLLDADTLMSKKLTLNYTEAKVVKPCIVSASINRVIRGHEFHYSALDNIANDSTFAYEMLKGKGIDGKHDGLIVYNTLASYMHIHFAYKDIVKNVIEGCRAYKRK